MTEIILINVGVHPHLHRLLYCVPIIFVKDTYEPVNAVIAETDVVRNVCSYSTLAYTKLR